MTNQMVGLPQPHEIQVPLQVTRYRTRKGSCFVEVWGYVGDYEVMMHITILEAVHKGLISQREAVEKGLVHEFTFREKSRRRISPTTVRVELE